MRPPRLSANQIFSANIAIFTLLAQGKRDRRCGRNCIGRQNFDPEGIRTDHGHITKFYYAFPQVHFEARSLRIPIKCLSAKNELKQSRTIHSIREIYVSIISIFGGEQVKKTNPNSCTCCCS